MLVVATSQGGVVTVAPNGVILEIFSMSVVEFTSVVSDDIMLSALSATLVVSDDAMLASIPA